MRATPQGPKARTKPAQGEALGNSPATLQALKGRDNYPGIARITFLLLALLLAGGYLRAQNPQPVNPEQNADGIVVPIGDKFLKVQFWSDSIVRVVSAKDRAFLDHSTPATEVRHKETTTWKLTTSNNVATLTTAKLQVHVDLATGVVSFFDAAGNPILAEKPGGRRITPAEVQNEKTFHIEQQWTPNAGESLYGLGQLQFGITDIKGYDLDLWQHNTCVVVPLLVSSRGYGVFWDNLSFTRFGDLRALGAYSRDLPL